MRNFIKQSIWYPPPEIGDIINRDGTLYRVTGYGKVEYNVAEIKVYIERVIIKNPLPFDEVTE